MIGERIRTYRQSKGAKVADFAKLIGVSQGSLSDIENQKTKPSAETISALVRHTDIDARWLLTGEGNPPEAKPVDRETRIINQMLEGMTEEQKAEVRKYCEMSKCYENMKPEKKARKAR